MSPLESVGEPQVIGRYATTMKKPPMIVSGTIAIMPARMADM